MFPSIKNYCFTISLDDAKWKDELLRATQVMNEERLTRFKNVLTPAKYYSTIHNKYIRKEDKKKDSLIIEYYFNNKEQIVNPNSKVSPLLNDNKGNSSKSMSKSEANSNSQYNKNS